MMPLFSYGIELNEYRVIESKYHKSYLNGYLSLSDGNQEQIAYDVHFDVNSKILETSPNYSWEFDGILSSDFSQSANKESDTKKRFDFFGTTRFEWYFGNTSNYFVYNGADIGYKQELSATEPSNLLFKAGAGLGVGRIYDATSLAIALRIMEMLENNNLFTKPLEDEKLFSLAEMVANQKRYTQESWYQAFKDLLGLNKSQLNAFIIMKIEEIISLEKISGRFHGWKVRTGLGQILSSYDGETHSSTLDAELLYGYAKGYKSLFKQQSFISAILDKKEPIAFQFRNVSDYTFELGDRISWEQRWVLEVDKYQKGENVIKNNLISRFRYYLSNHLTLDTTLSLIKIEGTNGHSVATAEWDNSMFMGIRYQIH